VSGENLSKQLAVTTLLVFVFFFVLACVLESQFSAHAQEKTNPVKPSAESLAKGKKLYGIDCAMCHNQNGDGKNDMDIKVPDLTSTEVQSKSSDGQWFEAISKGKGDMPPEEPPRVKGDEEIWNLVNYCRTLGKK
jgi:mono/diheme cytochrome c family protein